MRLQTKEAQEFRLQQICALNEEGYEQTEIAQMLNCTQSWVSQVLRRAAIEGTANLKAKVSQAGNTAALQSEQLAELGLVLQAEARAAGFATDGWTQRRIAAVILERYGVRHHPSHISRLLAKIGFTRQKPLRRDYRHDASAVETWRTATLPQLKKS